MIDVYLPVTVWLSDYAIIVDGDTVRGFVVARADVEM